MVQVIPQAPPKHSKGKQFSEAVGKGLEAATAMMKENQTRQGMKDFAQTLIENNPDSKAHKTLADLYSSDLPIDHITKIAQSLTGMDPYKMQQQERLQIDTQAKLLNGVIKNLQKQKESTFNKDQLILIDSQLSEYQNQLTDLTQYAKQNGWNLAKDVHEIDQDEEDLKIKQRKPKEKKSLKDTATEIFLRLKKENPKMSFEDLKSATDKELEKLGL